MILVLVVIALFGALAVMLGSQIDDEHDSEWSRPWDPSVRKGNR